MNPYPLPPIFLAADEADQLATLASGAQSFSPAVAAFLEREIERAVIVTATRDLPPDAVRVGSLVTFRDDVVGDVREVTLVLPEHADVAVGKISVLTPVGAALIGMVAGQSIEFAALRGRRGLTVVRVHQPGCEDAAPTRKPKRSAAAGARRRPAARATGPVQP